MEINWNKQAKQFLESHNWRFEDSYGYHPCYPLAEDFSVEGSIEKFCEEFYSEAWRNHKAYIKGTAILSETAETETQGGQE